MWQYNFEHFNSAVSTGMGSLSELVGNGAHFNMACNLINDGAQYAAFKQNQERLALQDLMFDTQTGEQLSEADFLKEAEKISKLYNRSYLLTEENNARQGAVMARKWATFEENADLYPNLEYRAIMDNDTRDEHAEWHGTVLPINHPWWDSHYPPNGWNCRCDVIQTDKAVKKPVNEDDPNPGWKFNAGKERRLFPASATYYKVRNKAEIEKDGNWMLMNHTRKMLRKNFEKRNIELPGLGIETEFSGGCIKNITGKNDAKMFFNFMATYDLEERLRKGKLLEPVLWPDFKDGIVASHSKIKGWHNYEIELPNGEKGYVAVKVYKRDGLTRIHSITNNKPVMPKK